MFRFFTDDGALVRVQWDYAADRPVGSFDVLTRWGWREQRETGQQLRTIDVADARAVCERDGFTSDEPSTA